MIDEQQGTLLAPPRRFLGCPRWKGLFKEPLASIRARWKPRGVQESDGGYLILRRMRSVSLSHGTHMPLSYRLDPVFFFFNRFQ